MIGELNEAISKGGAWATDYKMFSNSSITILFEVSLRDIHKLHAALQDIPINWYEESIDCLKQVDQQQRQLRDNEIFDITGTLQVTFIHNDPDLKIKVPPFEL